MVDSPLNMTPQHLLPLDLTVQGNCCAAERRSCGCTNDWCGSAARMTGVVLAALILTGVMTCDEDC